ncbi:MAG: FecR family protein, partial [Pseudomonadota bacterium]|nr:FecR family protein [Pseudomonadota bacterium]
MTTFVTSSAAPGGAPSPVGHARSALALAALLALSGQAMATPAATVMFASGDAHVLSATGQAREAKSGSAVESGESIETGKGRVQLRMVDGALMSLREGTLLRLDDYHLAGPAGDDERGYMSLVRGALRTISGSIGKPRVDHYRLDAPAGTIGIRGTEYTAAVDNGLKVGVVAGRVAVCNDAGCVDVPKGSSAYTPARGTRPVVSVRVSLVVTPANAGAQTRLVAAASSDAGANAQVAATLTGDRVTRYLNAALSAPVSGPTPPSASLGNSDELPPLAGSQPAPASTGPASQDASPPPITIAPAPLPSVAPPAPAPAPSPAPGPAPAPAPGPA